MRVFAHAAGYGFGGRFHMHKRYVGGEPQYARLHLARDHFAVVIHALAAVAEVRRAVYGVVNVQADGEPVGAEPRIGLNVVVEAVPLRHLFELGAERQHLLALVLAHIRLGMAGCVRYLPVVVNERKSRADGVLHPVVYGEG